MVKATKLELKSLYEAADEFERLQPWEWTREAIQQYLMY